MSALMESSSEDVESVEEGPVSPLRVAVGDELGVIRTVELKSWADLAAAEVSSRHGIPDQEKGVTCMASTAEERIGALLCVGRRKGVMQVYTPHSLEICAQTQLQHSNPIYITPLLHSSTEQLPKVLTVTEDGYLHVMRFQRKCERVLYEETVRHPTKLKAVRRIQAAEQITTADLSEEGECVVFGGEDVNLTVCDLNSLDVCFTSKSPRNPYQLVKRNWVTACTFIPGSDGKLIFGGNAERELFLYDVRSNRRPVFVMEGWREARVTCAHPDPNGQDIWVANAMGYVDRFDLRKRSIRGTLSGQVAGSIRCLRRFDFASRPLIASVGLDRFLRIYSTEHRQLQTKCYCKYPLTAVETLPGTFSDDDEDASDDRDMKSIDDAEDHSNKRQRTRQ